ncbi:MAG TPA: hypothetical protein PKW87_07535 [Bacillota bacterium]|nr:hypothetical protein [Bacillota bacterium]
MRTIGKATLHADDDGLISLQCSRCKSRFKMDCAYVSELNEDIFCPVCGISESLSTFWPEEVIEEAKKVAIMEAEKMISQVFKGLDSKYIKVKSSPVRQIDSQLTFKNKDYDMQIVEVQCCNKKIGLNGIDFMSGFYCPYCGRMAK